MTSFGAADWTAGAEAAGLSAKPGGAPDGGLHARA